MRPAKIHHLEATAVTGYK